MGNSESQDPEAQNCKLITVTMGQFLTKPSSTSILCVMQAAKVPKSHVDSNAYPQSVSKILA